MIAFQFGGQTYSIEIVSQGNSDAVLINKTMIGELVDKTNAYAVFGALEKNGKLGDSRTS